ncbi:MAG: septal ring lytic transglycosylase RlpA family protein [Oscillatoriales cyanobacterium SM2_1_8]|nr:septal ring lytic transglycosylase RlpA family protein [Oscillatoriales cyanobacterium SM2_1_8]
MGACGNRSGGCDRRRQPPTGLGGQGTVEAAAPAARPSSLKVGETRSQGMQRVGQDSLSRVIPHTENQRSAATVFLRGLPVVTYLGPADKTPAVANQNGTSVSDVKVGGPSGQAKTDVARGPETLPGLRQMPDPVERGAVMAATLTDLARSGVAADTVQAVWQDGVFWVRLGDRAQIALEDGVQLPNTTGDREQDALQMANLLRRLLGDAPPLTAVVNAPRRPVVAQAPRRPKRVLAGLASWYGPGLYGRPTATGRPLTRQSFHAAHPYLPLGTTLRITNVANGRSTVLRVEDRGPFHGNRLLDITEAAARPWR